MVCLCRLPMVPESGIASDWYIFQRASAYKLHPDDEIHKVSETSKLALARNQICISALQSGYIQIVNNASLV